MYYVGIIMWPKTGCFGLTAQKSLECILILFTEYKHLAPVWFAMSSKLYR